jgi:hypothetical protein
MGLFIRATSVLQQAAESTLSRTSMGPGSGVDTSLISSWLGPINTAPFMVSGRVAMASISFSFLATCVSNPSQDSRASSSLRDPVI